METGYRTAGNRMPTVIHLWILWSFTSVRPELAWTTNFTSNFVNKLHKTLEYLKLSDLNGTLFADQKWDFYFFLLFCTGSGVDFINCFAPYYNLLRLAPNFCQVKSFSKVRRRVQIVQRYAQTSLWNWLKWVQKQEGQIVLYQSAKT